MSAIRLLVGLALELAWWVLVARILFSWIEPRPSMAPVAGLVRWVYRVTDPPLDAVRRALPFLVVGGLDLTPIVLFVALGALNRLI